MGKIETSNTRQKSFSDSEMSETVEWDDEHRAEVDDELEEYLTDTYTSISSVVEEEPKLMEETEE